MRAEEFAQELRQKFQKMKEELPKQLAEMAREEFVASFDKQGWEGTAWEPRKEPTGSWPILVKSGALKSSVESSIKQVSWEQTTLTTDVPYAEFHNDGTPTLPQRQFFGASQALEAKMTELIQSKLKETLE